MNAILLRLREPSTYAGLSVLLGMFGVSIAPEAFQAVVQIATGGAALVAILLREKGR